MGIRPDRGKFIITVERASALKGFRRIRKFRDTLEKAEALDLEINRAIEVYGKWPVEEGDKPLRLAATPYRKQGLDQTPRSSGTLREATRLTIETHWSGLRYERVVTHVVWSTVEFLEKRGVMDIDDITSADLDAIVAHGRSKGNSANTINKHLYALSKVNEIAMKRIPPLANIKLPIGAVSIPRIEKWWLRPEDQERVTMELRKTFGQLTPDPLFADLIEVICFQGFRVEEALRLEPRHIVGLNGREPWVQPPGTKTANAQNSIPIYPQAVTPLRSAIERAEHHKWTRLFPLTPRQVRERWNNVREFLGVSDLPTATMKSLRRTFAWYANSVGMPTATLQKVLRHRTIGTTAGYLDLVGGGEMGKSREFFSKDSPQVQTERSNVGSIIRAYAETPGVTPEDVARFAKELMT